MNLVLIDLKNLQEVDDQLKANRQAAETAAARQGEAEARLKAFEAKLAKVTEELAAMHRRHLELEDEVRQLSAKRAKNQERQGALKTDAEFAALAKEAEYLAGRVNGLEDEILELLDRIEKAEVEKADLALVLTEEAGAYAKITAEIEAALQAGAQVMSGLTAKRATLVEGLPPANLRQYDELVKIRAGRAVASAVAGLCQACSLGFPPQLFNDLQRNEKIQTCPNCGRILYWRDHPDFKSEEGPLQA